MHRQPRRLNTKGISNPRAKRRPNSIQSRTPSRPSAAGPAPRARYVSGTRIRADQLRRARAEGQREHERGPRGEPEPALAPSPAQQARLPAGGPPRPYEPVPYTYRYADDGPPASPRRRRLSPARALVLGVPLLFLVVVGGYVGFLALRAQQAANKIFSLPRQPHPIVRVNAQGTPEIVTTASAGSDSGSGAAIADWPKTDRVNILLLGVDDRHDGSPTRSDTMIVVSIDPSSKTIGMVSIPRDLLVSIPGVGDDKVNAAYPDGEAGSVGGAQLARATVEYNFKIPIDYVATVDFTGFQKIVDTLGGVTLDVPAPIKDDEYPSENYNYTRVLFHSGIQHMDGATALHYARTRHDDNDFARGARQQQVLKALREEAVSLNLITRAPDLISNLGDTVHTSMPMTDALSLAKLVSQIKGQNIKSYDLLPDVTEQNDARGYYLIPDWAKIHATFVELMGTGQSQTAGSSATKVPTAAPTQAPNYDAAVEVLNATSVNHLAANSSAVLENNGFSNVTPAQASQPGTHPKSQIVDYSGNPATARRIAQLLGLPTTIVKQGDPGKGDGFDVVVTLGEDAPIPTASP